MTTNDKSWRGYPKCFWPPHFPELESTGPFCAVVAESRKYWRIRNHRLGWWKVRDDMALPTRGQHPQKIFVKILHFGAF